MKIDILQAEKKSNTILKNIGFNKSDSELITKNLIEAEMSGKRTHGLVRLPWFKGISEHLNSSSSEFNIIEESDDSLLVDANYTFGIPVIEKSIDYVLKNKTIKNSFSLAIKNTGYSGYITSFARKVVNAGYIFISFNNSPAKLIPHGSTAAVWGTNPICVAIPSSDVPVILDMASSQVTYGNLLLAALGDSKVGDGLGLDGDGNPTTDAQVIIDEGGLFPIENHKGSGLGFIIELLAGAMTGSMIGKAVEGGWGSYSLIINPESFRARKDFLQNIDAAIEELKNAPKADGVEEIFFPGEQSFYKYEDSKNRGYLEIEDILNSKLEDSIAIEN